MNWNKKSPMIALIAGEFAFGIALSIIFFKLVSGNDAFLGNSFSTGVFRFYGALSIVFFVSVFSVGIFGAIKRRHSNKIANAILYSILFWLLSIVLYAVTLNFLSYKLNLRTIPLYLILAGIIVGFNLGMKPKFKTENDVR
jgi:hypothetical protein